ncbi:hypothetical protein GCM10009828_032790 [Actinoplanes couchii]|uniref:Uncharacterized protein n=1 Tax=Actinoplanes couchii TaxID=403638 RepID=A0ABQ3XB94_9ACTN|nr:hypothetical protein Aco03nite_041600 [Actinoplanes couchii]
MAAAPGVMGAGEAGTVGAVDAGAADIEAVDTGAVDTGAVDTGAGDAGTVDTGTVDTGTVDAGTVDAGAVEGGMASSVVVRASGGGVGSLWAPLLERRGVAIGIVAGGVLRLPGWVGVNFPAFRRAASARLAAARASVWRARSGAVAATQAPTAVARNSGRSPDAGR